jgi:hypothetical protein
MSQAEVSTTILVEVVAEYGGDGDFPFPIQHAMTQILLALRGQILDCAHPKPEAPAPAVGNAADRVALIGANDGRCGYYNPNRDSSHRSIRCPNQAYAYVFKGSDPKNPITLACLDHADELVENGAAWRRGERLPRLTPRPGIVLPSEERSS